MPPSWNLKINCIWKKVSYAVPFKIGSISFYIVFLPLPTISWGTKFLREQKKITRLNKPYGNVFKVRVSTVACTKLYSGQNCHVIACAARYTCLLCKPWCQSFWTYDLWRGSDVKTILFDVKWFFTLKRRVYVTL